MTTPALIYAPGERYVLAHRVPSLEAGPSTVTKCRLPIGDDWQGLPPDSYTPICEGCSPKPQPDMFMHWEAPPRPEPEEDPPAPPAPAAAPEPSNPVRAAHEPPQPPQDTPPPARPAPIKARVWRLLYLLWRGPR